MAYRDAPPAGKPKPYVVVHERIALVPDPLEDGGPGTAVESVQVELWQSWHYATAVPGHAAGDIAEDYLLLPALEHGLHGRRTVAVGGVPGAAGTVYRVFVRNTTRLVDQVEDLIRDAITVDVWRQF